jgi:hypothetical protein
MEEKIFKNMANRHLMALFLWFFACLTIVIFSYEMSIWADHLSGWQSQFVFGLFTLVSAISGFSGFFLGILIYDWFKEYKNAFSEFQKYGFTEMDRSRKKIVLGPIPWR